MADDDKKEPTTNPDQPWIAPSPEPAAEEPDEVVKAHQATVKAELDYAEATLKAKEKLEKAQENLSKARAKAAGVDVDAGAFPGYWHKTWAGHDCLQCAYCSWDVVTSSLYDYVTRMGEHLATAHPNWQQLPAIFDKAGNFVEGGVQ